MPGPEPHGRRGDGGSEWLTHLPGAPACLWPGWAARLLRSGTGSILPPAEQPHSKAPLGKLLLLINNHIGKVTFYLKAADPHSQWLREPQPGFLCSPPAGRPPSSGCCQDFLFSSTSSPKFLHFGDGILGSRMYCLCSCLTQLLRGLWARAPSALPR